METAILKIVKDRPPPIIVAQAALEAPPPTNTAVAEAVPRGRGQHLDVDGILARSLPAVRPVNESRPRPKVEPPTLSEALV